MATGSPLSVLVLIWSWTDQNLHVGLNNLIGKFADDTKIGKSVLTDGDRSSLQDLLVVSAWSKT